MARGMSFASVTSMLCLVIGMRDAGDVGFLEGVGADQRAGLLPGDGDQRDRVHVRVGDRGDQVRRARAGGGHAHPDLAGGLRVAGGRVPGALLVADQHVPHPGGVQQRVVGRQDGAAGDAEHDLAADLLERPDQRLGAGHRHLVEPGAGRVLGQVARAAGVAGWLGRTGGGAGFGTAGPDRGVAVVICGSASLRCRVRT